MNTRSMIAGAFALAGVLCACGEVVVGPGEYSSFSTDAGNAVVVGVSGLTWSNFNGTDNYGTKCFVNTKVVDAEKTAVDDDDDYWCGPITDMNLLYITGWAGKTKYATVDDMVDYFRANKKLLRYARTPGNIATVTEGTYGYDGLFRWFKDTTKVDLSPFTKTSYAALDADTLGMLMDNGEYVLNISVAFNANNGNQKWNGWAVTHAVTCCGYEKDSSGALTALFIIDSDNDQYAGTGGRNAPNSIMYCRVTDGDAVKGIWGVTSRLVNGYTALKTSPKDPVAVKLDGNGGKADVASMLFEDGQEYEGLPSASRKNFVFAGWWTEKEGGEKFPDSGEFDASLFAGQKTPTLYAHWLAVVKLTLKDDSAYVEWNVWDSFDADIVDRIFITNPDLVNGEFEGKGTVEVLQGSYVYVEVNGEIKDKNGNGLSFQKWTVSPSGADMGPNFQAGSYYTDFSMPGVAVTLQATYIDPDVCGWIYAAANFSSVFLGYDEELEDYAFIELPEGAAEWSPDGGKTWYKSGSEAMLKAGKYTITWRSIDSNWQAPDSKMPITVQAGNYWEIGSKAFSYIPSVVIDVMTVEGGECTASSAGGTATMSSKDGRATGKSITFTAKAAKNYAFQGWAFGKNWVGMGSPFAATTASWKIENSDGVAREMNHYIDPEDLTVHVVAVFKALADYSADDIEFSHLSSRSGRGYSAQDGGNGNVNVDVRGYVGCLMEYSLRCGPLASPLSYKLGGKLPAGLKFDAKTGTLTGIPTKPGKASVVIVATDPVKNSKSLTVNIDVSALPAWLVGDYRGLTNDSRWDYDPESDVEFKVQGPSNGLLELSVTSAGKVSAKVFTKYGTRSVSGTLEWRDPECEYFEDDDMDEEDEDEDSGAEFRFWHTVEKDDSYCHVGFYDDGTIDGYVDSYDKSDDDWAGGDMTGMRQDKDLFAKSNFVDKYYTFAFCSETEGETEYDEEDNPIVTTVQSGYGYLTLKTDKKGVAKVAGQLPDGEKVSVSALVMPINDSGDENPAADDISARLYVFASPSSYKKAGWFAMSLSVMSDGSINSDDGAAWTISDADGYTRSICEPVLESPEATVWGLGALYSEAKTLEGYYWNVFCAWSDQVQFEYSWKDSYVDEDTGKTVSYTEYDTVTAYDFDNFFNVLVMGDSKGAINLAQKSPAPWIEKETMKGDDGKTHTESWWNFLEDKKGNEITDPSQLSISFAKATGIFTGKASVYFEYDQPSYNKKTGEFDYTTKQTSATLPYSGVMVREEYDGEVSYTGFGSAVYSYKYTEIVDEATGKGKANTRKITLPVSLEAECGNCGEPIGD